MARQLFVFNSMSNVADLREATSTSTVSNMLAAFAAQCACAPKVDVHNRPSFGVPQPRMIVRDRWMSLLLLVAHLIGSLANSLSSSWVTTCGSFVVGNLRSCTLNDTPADMTASMASSHHVFLSPRVQANLHVAHTSMLSIDVRSPRSDVECRGGDRQGAFNRTQRNFMSVLSLRVNMGFTQPLGPLS